MGDAADRWAAVDAEWLAASPAGAFERPLFRMPAGFGRVASQRNHPMDKAGFVGAGRAPLFRVTVRTDPDLLGRILPPGVVARGVPRLQVGVTHVQDAYWLAGRGYHSLSVRVPVTVTRDDPPVDGHYYAVKWDSLADNVITAREDIGWPALWAEVSPPIRQGPDGYAFNASWLGFRFFDMEITDLGEPRTVPRDDSTVQVTYKYVPVGYEPGADTSRLIVNDLATYWSRSASVQGARTGREADMVSAREGRGDFTFHPARWEDMPTQFHVVNMLVSLPVIEVIAAEAIESPYM